MNTDTPRRDVIDGVVDDVRAIHPDLEVLGLPIVGRVLRLAHFLAVRREGQLATYGLTPADFDVLATMRRRAGAESINVRDLQQATMLSSGGTTKRLDRLVQKELVERLPDPNDRRGVLIRLSPDGLALIDEVMPAITRAESDLIVGSIGSTATRNATEQGLRQLLLEYERA